MKTKQLSEILVATFSGMLILIFPTLAKGESEPELVLPDSYFINKECNLLRLRTSATSVSQRFYELIDELCKNYNLEEIDGDEWLKEIALIRNLLEEANSTDIVLSLEDERIFCERFPLNSRCSGSMTTTTTPGPSSIPAPDSTTTTTTPETSTAFTQPATDLALAITVPNLKPIPKGYSAYTIFLFPSQEWIDSKRQKELKSLRQAFNSFGEAIGNKKVAIWFSNRTGSGVDTKRSKDYCDKFRLNYNDGPYIVVTQKRPDEIQDGDEIIVIKFSGISSDRYLRVLNLLEQNLRNNEIQERSLLFEEIKQRLFTAADSFDLKGIVLSIIK